VKGKNGNGKQGNGKTATGKWATKNGPVGKKGNTKQLSRRNRNGTLSNKNSNHRLPQTYFFLPAHISLPSFPAAQFSVPLFTGCRFFRCPYPVAVIFDINFLSPFFPTLLFLLPNFQVANFPIAQISVAVFTVALCAVNPPVSF